MSGDIARGRVLAARLEMLAAEISEPGRLWRGRSYVEAGAVGTVELHDGRFRARVQGSMAEPYRLTLGRTHRNGPPQRSDLFWSCTCADSASPLACKHVAALLLTIAADVADEPELVDRWGESATTINSGTIDPGTIDPGTIDSAREPQTGADHRQGVSIDHLDDLVIGPEALERYELGDAQVIQHPLLTDPVVDRLLRAALDVLVEGRADQR